jgi:hypothetical protein
MYSSRGNNQSLNEQKRMIQQEIEIKKKRLDLAKQELKEKEIKAQLLKEKEIKEKLLREKRKMEMDDLDFNFGNISLGSEDAPSVKKPYFNPPIRASLAPLRETAFQPFVNPNFQPTRNFAFQQYDTPLPIVNPNLMSMAPTPNYNNPIVESKTMCSQIFKFLPALKNVLTPRNANRRSVKLFIQSFFQLFLKFVLYLMKSLTSLQGLLSATLVIWVLYQIPGINNILICFYHLFFWCLRLLAKLNNTSASVVNTFQNIVDNYIFMVVNLPNLNANTHYYADLAMNATTNATIALQESAIEMVNNTIVELKTQATEFVSDKADLIVASVAASIATNNIRFDAMEVRAQETNNNLQKMIQLLQESNENARYLTNKVDLLTNQVQELTYGTYQIDNDILNRDNLIMNYLELNQNANYEMIEKIDRAMLAQNNAEIVLKRLLQQVENIEDLHQSDKELNVFNNMVELLGPNNIPNIVKAMNKLIYNKQPSNLLKNGGRTRGGTREGQKGGQKGGSRTHRRSKKNKKKTKRIQRKNIKRSARK